MTIEPAFATVEALQRLSRRQRQVARHFAHGLTYKQIANKLSIAPSTVRNHLAAIYRDAGINNKIELARLVAASDGISGWASAAADAPLPLIVPAESRQLTIMRYEIVDGEADLVARKSPDCIGTLRSCRAACQSLVASFGGHVADSTTDRAATVYFGYPRACEDAVERALRAALELVAAVRRSRTHAAVSMSARIAIVTETVTFGEVERRCGERERTAQDETPVLMAMLGRSAISDGIVVTSSTRRIAGATFSYASLGAHQIVDNGAPVLLWQVKAVRAVSTNSRFASRTTRLTPLAGRRVELELLKERWIQAVGGEGQVVLLTGEAGIGKSRIIHELSATYGVDDGEVFYYQGSPFNANTAFYPFIEFLTDLLSTDEAGSDGAARAQALVEEFGEDPAQSVPLLADLLSIPLGDRYPPLKLSPERRRHATSTLLCRLALSGAQTRPRLVVFEDIHWFDPSASAVLGQLLDAVQDLKALLIMTARPMSIPRWPAFSHVTALTLNRLGRDHILDMIEGITDNALPRDMREHIAKRSDGIPLFAEEMAKTMLESNRTVADELASFEVKTSVVPATLEGALMARLDSRENARQIAQLGACIGREFSYRVLAAIAPLSEQQLVQGLDQLVEAELVFRRGAVPRSSYVFKHALVRDVASRSVPIRIRQELHARIVTVLRSQFPDLEFERPELIARHLSEAGLAAEAVGYWREAGAQSVTKSSNLEAIEQLSSALTALAQLPDGRQRDRDELGLRMLLGVAQQAVLGHASSQVKENYARAQRLCDLLDEDHERVPVLRGLYISHLMRGDLADAHRFGEKLLDIARRADNDTERLEAHFAIGQTNLVHIGDFAEAGHHFDQGVAIYDLNRHGDHAYRFGQDPGVFCLQLWSLALQIQGYPDTALNRSRQARDLAAKIGHPLTLASAYIFAAQLHQWRREPDTVIALADSARSIAEEQLLLSIECWAQILVGWASTYRRSAPDWKAMERALNTFSSVGIGPAFTIVSGVYADAHLEAGRPEVAARTVDRALESAARWEEPYMVPELLRLKGNVRLADGRLDDALVTFEQAAHAARAMNANFWRLRIAADAARASRGHGGSARTRESLGKIYGEFTEGFATADLRDVKALLDNPGS